jgi:integrase
MPIRKRNGQWHYRLWVHGREYTGSSGLEAIEREKKRAEVLAETIRQEIITGRPAHLQADSVTFSVAAAEFLSWCRNTEYRSRLSTALRIAGSSTSLRQFFGERLVKDVQPGDVERYKTWRIAECGVKDVTLRHDLDALSIFFKRFARKFGWCTGNPVDDVTRPSDKDAVRIHVLDDAEERAYFGKCRDMKKVDLYDAARLILLQGCRPEEVYGLPQVAVDVNAERIHILGGKTRAARRVLDLTGESVEILKRRLQRPGKWVFPSQRKPGHHIVKLAATHDEVCREAGVSFVLYDLRHTFATRLADAGVPITTIAALLGHSGLRMVMRYVHPSAESKKAAMQKYERMLRPRLRRVR